MFKVSITLKFYLFEVVTFESLILKVTSMRKFTNLVVYVLLYLGNIIFIEINYIRMRKLSINLKYH